MSRKTNHIKAPKDFSAYINRLLDYLLPRMHLSDYLVTWKYVKVIGGAKGLRPIVLTENGYAADFALDPVYLTVDIRFSKKAYTQWKSGNRHRFCLDLVHELSHAYTYECAEAIEILFRGDELKRTLWRQINEAHTERISKTIWESIPREVWK